MDVVHLLGIDIHNSDGNCTMVVAWMMLPLATSKAALVDSWSLTKSSTNGVMWVEHPESINLCDNKEVCSILL